MNNNLLIHLAGRIFGTPLLIQQQKLDVILQVLGPRLGIDGAPPMETPEPYSPFGHDVPDNIALVQVIGPLVKRSSGMALSGGPTTYGEIAEAFEEAYTSPSISGILVEIDSPGGEVGGLFELADMIYQARGTKPIYAVANDDAFSAAYAIASACDRIYVTQTGGVGSVGVIAAHVDQSAFDERLGVSYTYVYAGDRKKDMNPHEPLSDEAKAALQTEIDRLYDIFVGAVARNRNLKATAVRDTQAGLYFGPDGVAVGFADSVGTFDDALAAIVEATTPKSSRKSAIAPKKEIVMAETEVPVPAAEPTEQPAANPTKAAEATTGDPGASTSTVIEIVVPVNAMDAASFADYAKRNSAIIAEGAAPPVEAAAAIPDQGTAAVSVSGQVTEMSGVALPPVDPSEPAVIGTSDVGSNAAIEIVNICAAVGLKAEAARRFIERGLTPAQVSRQLAEERAAATDANPIASQVRPENNGTSDLDAARAQAATIAKEKGISAEAALVELVQKNPRIYQQYLASSQQPKK